MAKDTFLSSTTWQVSLSSCNLLSRILTLIVHMHATKECRGSGGIAPHILKVGTRWMRVVNLTLQETPPANRQTPWRSLSRNGIRTLDRPSRSPVIVLSYPCC
jgi:hypothetical protein